MTTDCSGSEAPDDDRPLVLWLDSVGESHLNLVGHKAVNLSRVRRLQVAVPDGFVLTTRFIELLVADSEVEAEMERLRLGYSSGELSQVDYSDAASSLILGLEGPEPLRGVLADAYERLVTHRSPQEADQAGSPEPALVVVRSNAVGEDSLGASFAGQHDSVLGVSNLDQLLRAYLRVVASSVSVRALSYRRAVRVTGASDQVPWLGMSVLVQRMVRSDLGSAGVMITSAPEPDAGVPSKAPEPSDVEPGRVTIIEAVRGTGESIVGGTAKPETHIVRPALGSTGPVAHVADQIGEVPVIEESTALKLGEWGRELEREFGTPVEVEWALDGLSGELAVVQVRPIAKIGAGTGASGQPSAPTDSGSDPSTVRPALLGLRPLASGLAIGTGMVEGTAVVVDGPSDLLDSELVDTLPEDFVLVVATTSPEWVPLMRLATALVTDVGGRGSHAAIVCRELGLPAVLGCGDATTVLGALPVGSAGPDQFPGPRARRVVVDCTDGATGTVYG